MLFVELEGSEIESSSLHTFLFFLYSCLYTLFIEEGRALYRADRREVERLIKFRCPCYICLLAFYWRVWQKSVYYSVLRLVTADIVSETQQADDGDIASQYSCSHCDLLKAETFKHIQLIWFLPSTFWADGNNTITLLI